MRTKLITIAGKEYWIAYSAQSQINMESLRRQPDFDPKTRGGELTVALLREELRAGYLWAKRNNLEAAEPPKDVAELIDWAEAYELMTDLTEIMNGDRNVLAKPPKKDEAGQSAT